MHRMIRALCFVALASLLGLGACGEREREDTSAPAGRLHVVVTIPPLKGLVEPLLGDSARVDVLVPPGSSVHGWDPRPADLAMLMRADLVVLVGLGLEPAIERALAANRDRAPIHVAFADAAEIRDQPHDHDHGDHDHDHDHGPIDPHLWLDPGLVPHLLRAVAERAQESGADRAGLVAGMRETLTRLEALDGAYRTRLAPFAGAAVIADHAAWERLLERYGLRLAAVVRPIPQAEPRPGQIASVVEAVREQGAGVLIVEPQWSGRAARQVSDATGVAVAELDPLGDGDWFAMMERNLDALARALEGEE